MRRALAEFEAVNLQAIAAPTVLARGPGELTWDHFVPTARAYFESAFALHEWLGIAWAGVSRRD